MIKQEIKDRINKEKVMLKYIGDFERLKEFGFIHRKETKDDYETYYIDTIEGCILTRTGVYPHNRKIWIAGDSMDIVYDFITSGLVEKVVEE